MKIIFDKKFLEEYDHTRAGDIGRLEPAYKALKGDPHYIFVNPKPAPLEAIERAHSTKHIKDIKKENHSFKTKLYDIARLAAGGAILCADIAKTGNPAFGLIRPPGHHASYDSCWGFCYFNNIAVSLLHLRETSECKRAFILDFDLHVGDGNINIMEPLKDYEILNPHANNEESYLKIVKERLENAKDCDIIVASAGFDQGIDDWGRLLSPDAYFRIGTMMKEFAEKRCNGKRYALLEGGYNFRKMAINIKSFCEGFR